MSALCTARRVFIEGSLKRDCSSVCVGDTRSTSCRACPCARLTGSDSNEAGQRGPAAHRGTPVPTRRPRDQRSGSKRAPDTTFNADATGACAFLQRDGAQQGALCGSPAIEKPGTMRQRPVARRNQCGCSYRGSVRQCRVDAAACVIAICMACVQALGTPKRSWPAE